MIKKVYSEKFLIPSPQNGDYDFLTVPFSLIELINILRSSSFGLDGIFLLLLKSIPIVDVKMLLSILNKI